VRYRDDTFALERRLRDATSKHGSRSNSNASKAASTTRSRRGCADARIDRVFLTGGSALVPAVRHIFERRFGGREAAGGEELTSVASGLALRPRRLSQA